MLILSGVARATVRGPSKNEEQIVEYESRKSKDSEDRSVEDNDKVGDGPDEGSQNQFGNVNLEAEGLCGPSDEFTNIVVVVAEGDGKYEKNNNNDNNSWDKEVNSWGAVGSWCDFWGGFWDNFGRRDVRRLRASLGMMWYEQWR